MKKSKMFMLSAMVLVGCAFTVMPGCTHYKADATIQTSGNKPQPPLPTAGSTAPPYGCVALRKRGGAC